MRAKVEKETDELIRDFAAARRYRKTTKQYVGLLKLWGAHKPRKVQIATAIKKRMSERARQKRIVARVAKLMKENPVREQQP